jgi:sugar-specific transcriptional regulator TrmB
MATNRNRDATGRFTAAHEVERADVFAALEPLEPYTTREVADALEIPRRSAYEYLTDLADDDAIRKKKTEPRRAIWIRPEDPS